MAANGPYMVAASNENGAKSTSMRMGMRSGSMNGGSVPGAGYNGGDVGAGLLGGKVGNGAPVLKPVEYQRGGEDENEKIYGYIIDLMNAQRRETALLELSKRREHYDNLALILWHSYGVMTTLVQEIISVFPQLSQQTLSAGASNRVCNALALLQCVASHNETRQLFLNAHLSLFLYPFLATTSKARPFEFLRLTSLGVIGALVKNDSSEVVNFLLQTEIIPLCLKIMEDGSELSKTVAIFIIQKILIDEQGLAYICQNYGRFFAVATVLNRMVNQLLSNMVIRLLKHVVRCYLRLSEHPKARAALRQVLPDPLKDGSFSQVLKDDAGTKRCLTSLLYNLSDH